MVGVGKNRILVLLPHQTGVGANDDLQSAQEADCHLLTPLPSNEPD